MYKPATTRVAEIAEPIFFIFKPSSWFLFVDESSEHLGNDFSEGICGGYHGRREAMRISARTPNG
jgi:hypothetical protein